MVSFWWFFSLEAKSSAKSDCSSLVKASSASSLEIDSEGQGSVVVEQAESELARKKASMGAAIILAGILKAAEAVFTVDFTRFFLSLGVVIVVPYPLLNFKR
jgi:hypothetical protein